MRWLKHLIVSPAFVVASATATAQEAAPKLIAEPRVVTSSMPSLKITPAQATMVGRQVWRNETGGDRDAITSWNEAESFASVGIGHFIWFPAGLETRFKESFPAMLQYLRSQGADVPAWLDKDQTPPCPWTRRADFKRQFRSAKMVELREFLLATVGLQTEYLSLRMQAALPKILETLSDERDRDHVRQQFNRVAAASPDLYPLIDYVNFKGEGISPKETYPNRVTGEPEGWGLKHVLLEMQGTSTDQASVLNAFSDASGYVLKRRVSNNPPNKRWQRGWLVRTETYRRPLQ